MSHFATMSGVELSDVRVPGVVFTPAELAQEYIRNLRGKIAVLDGEPVYLCDDGSTGTSHEIVSAAEEAASLRGDIDSSTVFALLNLCERTGAVLRVWWASNDPEAYSQVTPCSTLREAIDSLLAPTQPLGWHIRYAPNPAFNRTSRKRAAG